MVRTYSSNSAILDGYYIYIHPFFPILPAPARVPRDHYQVRLQTQIDEFDDNFKPSSPLSLAIAAILALIPCAEDAVHADRESVVFRRTYCQYLAQATVEGIEMETEIPVSSIEPQRALETDEAMPRAPVNPSLPLELESIVALDILSVYEYAQRGNMKRMQSRAGQALVAAMAQSLHLKGRADEFSEARRRVWWMTYVCVCQGSIVGNSKPTFEVFSSSFTQTFPTLKIDPEAFPHFIQAQQAILSATEFVVELNRALGSQADMTRIFDRMRELEAFLDGLNSQAESWTLSASTTSPMEPSEEVLSRSLRCMARIKINSARIKVHRYCAFFDIPVFTKRHCDLNPAKSADMDEPRHWPSCPCSSLSSASSAPSIATRSDSPHSTPPPAMMPFSSHESAKICLRSALNIAQAFDKLPFPNPAGQRCERGAPCYLSPVSSIVAPRTMPSFACCAMQCAYALLMVRHKTHALYPPGATSSALADSLLGRVQRGLASILATLENYATAFEALGGMRDQIRSAIDAADTHPNNSRGM
ncbi:hypothetical protein SCUCBS95973_009652 [Sporothrix curviconia]|uniref:C6 zinc finger domain containing protein n=1 Tax=Sporothrix curviconia TaxID=1260050 RepID=A0ABP0CZY4_9PEZI